tara:strand:- start:388 stop:1008 length:621 start_codon:yes stop_codon:yes gene_type:complete
MSDNEDILDTIVDLSSSDEDIKEYNEDLSDCVASNEGLIDEIVSDDLTTSIQKPKKARTEKQKEALLKAQETRRKNLKKKKQMELDNKALLEENKHFLKQLATAKHNENLNIPIIKKKVRPVKKKPKIIYEDESSDEEEVVIVKRRPKKAPLKKKKVIYQEESSSSDEEPTNDIQKKDVYFEQEEEEDFHYQYGVPLKYADLIKYN